MDRTQRQKVQDAHQHYAAMGTGIRNRSKAALTGDDSGFEILFGVIIIGRGVTIVCTHWEKRGAFSERISWVWRIPKYIEGRLRQQRFGEMSEIQDMLNLL